MNTSASQLPSSPSSSSLPRVGSFSSTGNGSDTSLTSYSSLNSHPSPASHTLKSHHYSPYDHYPVSYDYTRAMNATQSYTSHPHHGYMENHHAHMSSSAMPSSIPPYSHYQGAPMQPPMASYSQPPAYHYPYPQVVSSQPHPTQHYAQHTLPAPPAPQSTLAPHNRSIDQTGQVQPPNHKPKLTGTVWEDEGTICFQVEVNGICVARREDNHYINGTKLLNVANMTRGRRDGILKSEKLRSVIKIGPMHLKGVWIPFDRALEFANKEKITEQLYPLFVEDISPLLTPHMQETLRGARVQNGQQQLLRNSNAPQSSQPASSHQPPVSTSAQPATPSSSLVSTSRTVERSNTFPTPPTSTSSIIGVSQNSNYNDWNGLAPSSQAPLSVDTSTHGKSLPATPTTAPSEHSMQQQYSAHYDPSRSIYSAPPQQHYSGANYSQVYPIKTEMAAPARPGDKEEEPNHYGHDQTYAYNSSEPVNGDAKSSPHTQGSGRATPRSITTPQQQWQSTSYATPQGRAHHPLPSSSLTFGSSVASNGYTAPTPPPAPSYAYTNGNSGSLKRSRDDEDDDPYARPMSSSDSLKRRRTMPLPSEVSRSSLVQQHM